MNADSVYRIEAYLTEIEAHNLKPHALKYADEIHGLNDQVLRISDLRALFDEMRRLAQRVIRYEEDLRDLEDDLDAARAAIRKREDEK